MNDDEIRELAMLVTYLSKKYYVKRPLLNIKQDELVRKDFDGVQHNQLGKFQWRGSRLGDFGKITLFKNYSFDDYMQTTAHEFQHYLLYDYIPHDGVRPPTDGIEKMLDRLAAQDLEDYRKSRDFEKWAALRFVGSLHAFR